MTGDRDRGGYGRDRDYGDREYGGGGGYGRDRDYGGGGGYGRDRDRGDKGDKKDGRRRGCRDCHFIDYKDMGTLRRYISAQGKIYSRKRGSTCAKCQRLVTLAVKRARFMGILSHTN
ncbi:MAG: 30S ribosomal protein S18 [Planctomycetota bacterium]